MKFEWDSDGLAESLVNQGIVGKELRIIGVDIADENDNCIRVTFNRITGKYTFESIDSKRA